MTNITWFDTLTYGQISIDDHLRDMRDAGQTPEEYCRELADHYTYMTGEPQPANLYDELLADLLREVECRERAA